MAFRAEVEQLQSSWGGREGGFEHQPSWEPQVGGHTAPQFLATPPFVCPPANKLGDSTGWVQGSKIDKMLSTTVLVK